MERIRPPAVAGSFYPRTPAELQRQVDDFITAAAPLPLDLDPAMLIVPHAGYVYSGPVAATAYRILRSIDPLPTRIVLLGPAHFLGFRGIATPDADGLETPLGVVGIDPAPPPGISPNAAAHAREHSLEVQLPFLQHILRRFTVLPLLTGDVEPQTAADILDGALVTPGLAVISSDLSHYHDYETATQRDQRTAQAIVRLDADALRWDDACGRTAVQAALLVAQARGWHCRLLDLRNSGDTAGDHARVVGYGAFVLGPALMPS